ncbi:MAG: alpha/beta hydrolase [Pseudomonadota bacterium]
MVNRLLAALVFLAVVPAHAETIQFTAADGVTVTADLTAKSDAAAPWLILFHMARASRGEYREIAPRLARLGYSVMAIDQRSGGSFGGVENATRKSFVENPEFKAAIPDLKAAVAEAKKRGAQRLGVLGSSYSAALVIRLAGEDPGFADAVIAFSPGEYFQPRDFIQSAAADVSVPVLVTGARKEEGAWAPIFKALGTKEKTAFLPEGPGKHGATTLLTNEGPEYWRALETFLATYLPPS